MLKKDANIEKLVDSLIEKLRSSDIYAFITLDFDLLKKFLKRIISMLISYSSGKGDIKRFRKWGEKAYRIGIPNILILNIYTSIKEIFMREHCEEYLKNLDKALREFFKPYILDYYRKEEDTASVMDTSFDLIKTLEEAKKFHLNYIKSFLRAIVDDKEFNMFTPAKECPFYLYMEKLQTLKNDKVYLDIIKYHKDFHEVVNYTLGIKGEGFEEYFLAINELDRLSTKLLETLNSLLIKLLSKITVYDLLTQLFNRNYLFYTLNKELKRNQRYGLDLSLMMLDIDNFKSINDKYGHTVGDEVLKHVANIIRKSIRATDIPIRYGGEEFLIILPHTKLENAAHVAERIRLSIKEKPVEVENVTINVTVSIGVAKVNNFDDPIDNINRVDKAMYIAKRAGKDRVFILEDG